MTTTRLVFVGLVAACCSAPATARAQPRTPAPTPAARVVASPDRAQEVLDTVTLPLSEFNRLTDLAARPVPPADASPVATIITSADLRIRVERDSARGTFALAGDILRGGLNRVELLPGTTLLNGTAAGRPIPLVAAGDQPAALVQGIGPFGMTLEWGTPVTIQPGRASFVLPVPAAGTARATIDLPGEQAEVQVSRGLVTRRATANGRTIVDVTLEPGTPTDVSWSMRDSTPVAAAREARTVAEVMTLVTIGESDLRMAALVDVTVVQGEPSTIPINLPPGYEVTSLTGASLETSDTRDGTVTIAVTDPATRRHQFLISLERAHDNGSFSLDTATVTLRDVEREKGEVAIEGAGTLELETSERDGLRRMDVRELNPALASMARTPMLAAFRYQRGSSGAPSLGLSVKRFGDAGVLAAVAERGTATTMVTSEGRAITEVTLRVQNRAQPFLKLTLPPGATLASVEVAGEPAKPVLGTDGTRIPLLRPGFRPNGPYDVSFVFLHGGAPLAKRGDLQMLLPRMDVPIGIVDWEVFVPGTYKVTVVDGNVIDRRIEDTSDRSGTFYEPRYAPPPSASSTFGGGRNNGVSGGVGGGIVAAPPSPGSVGLTDTGTVFGRATDESGSPLPGVTVELRGPGRGDVRAVITDANGVYYVASVPAGTWHLTATLIGFRTAAQQVTMRSDGPTLANVVLAVGALEETITVSGAAPIDSDPGKLYAREPRVVEQPLPPSQSVLSLQRRAAGVLPIRIDVPRTGASYRFVKPLVVDQDTTVTLRYKRR